MDLLPDEAQQDVVDQTAAFLDDAMPIGRCRTGGIGTSRLDDEAWSRIAELGWLGLALPETRGGVGFTLVEEADYQELLVRTSSEGKKQAGITWVIGEMHRPGIEVRPIRTMDGGAEFCEVFYNDVRIPLENVVGKIDDGWSVAMSTLGFERGTGFMARQVAMTRAVEKLIEMARARPSATGRGSAFEDEHIANRLARLRAEVTAIRAMALAGISRAQRNDVPGPEGSLVKIFMGDLEQRMRRLAIEIMGPVGLEIGESAADWPNLYLRSYAATIGGGTSEIQRNIVGERLLGLPKDR